MGLSESLTNSSIRSIALKEVEKQPSLARDKGSGNGMLNGTQDTPLLG